ncbi:MAG: GerMN domain-containing protein, partial [Clostridia bacterium]|nr:GerMN domain-containing protein [Clostridia bacterium]
MKGIVNILIVILITYTLNAIPVNTTLLSFDLIKPWDKLSAENSDEPDSTEVPAPHISFNANKDTHLSNPSSLTLELTSDSALTDEQLKDLTDTLNITVSDTQNTRTLTPATVIKDAPTLIGDNLYALTFDVSKDTLECGMGQYEFSVAIGSELLHADAAAKTLLSYMPPIHYTPAIAEVDSNQIYTQVYYLNATKAFLVPVTKKLDASSKFIRNTISTLSYEAPNNEQLFAQNVVFPRLPKVYLHNSTLSCYLDGDDVSKFTSGSSENKLVSEAILRTLTSISYVDHMVFYVNDRQNGNFING